MKKVKLGDVCKIQSGGTPSRGNLNYWNNGNIPWVKISDIKEKHLSRTEEFITQEGLANSSAKIFPKETILYTIFATLGEVSILEIEATTNQAIAGLQIIDENICKDYLYYYLISLKPFVNEIGRGVAQNNINMQILRNFEIPLPSLEEQKAIARKLDKVSGLIEKRKTQLEKLSELVKSRFIELFGDPVKNDMDWKTTLLKNATSKIGSGATPKGGKESYQEEGITLIRSMNVHDGRFEYKDLAHITDEQAEQLDNVTVKENDVFINITGASVARSCIVPNHILPARVNQYVAIIRCITSMLNPVFANNMFLNTSFKGQLLNIGESGGATRQAITKQQLETLEVILPPIESQEQFATFVEQTDKSKFEIQKSLEKLEILKKSLMQQYFG